MGLIFRGVCKRARDFGKRGEIPGMSGNRIPGIPAFL